MLKYEIGQFSIWMNPVGYFSALGFFIQTVVQTWYPDLSKRWGISPAFTAIIIVVIISAGAAIIYVLVTTPTGPTSTTYP
jgi:hypothetical protein